MLVYSLIFPLVLNAIDGNWNASELLDAPRERVLQLRSRRDVRRADDATK